MHLDGFFFNCLVREIDSQLAGSRVEDVYSTEGGNLLLQVRAPGRTLRLEISVTSAPFAFFYTEQGRRGKSSGVFAQTLKKYVLGLFCVSISNPPFDRRAVLSFAPSPDSAATTFIHIELMGRQNDIILCQGSTITASTRPPRRDGIRALQPGDRYTPPPAAAKMPPQDLTVSMLETLFSNIGALTGKKALIKGVFGISPLLAEEICHRAGIAPNSPAQTLSVSELEGLTREIRSLAQASLHGQIEPVVYTKEGPYWTILQHLPVQPREYSSLCAALDFWDNAYRAGSGSDAIRTRLQTAIASAVRKLNRTIAKQEQEQEKAEESEHLRQIGDTLLASIHTIPRGSTSVHLDNVHTGQPMDISLDPEKSASSNASYYYKRYNKYKNALEKVEVQIGKNLNQLEYLNSLDYAVESSADLSDLQEIQEEMQEQGLLRRQGRGKSRIQPRDDYLAYQSPQGHPVLVGKNNRQNEVLTLKKADKNHYWLHTRHFPGSHVILCTANPDDAALEFAASLAAWHSKARSSPKVEVVWTQVKNVKKIPGAKPGMVQYSDYRSALIEPRRHSGGEESQ